MAADVAVVITVFAVIVVAVVVLAISVIVVGIVIILALIIEWVNIRSLRRGAATAEQTIRINRVAPT